MKPVVYGNIREDLIFIPTKEACRLARIHFAINTSKTWRDYLYRAGREAYDYAVAQGENERLPFSKFCADWIGDVPTMTTEQAVARFRSALKQYESLPPEERWPLPNEQFDVDLIGEGDYPDWPAQLMLRWVPKEIIWKYGKSESSVLNGDFLRFPVSRQDEIVAAFTAAGFECTSDQFLVRLASGESLPRNLSYDAIERAIDAAEGIERTPDIAQGVNTAWIEFMRRAHEARSAGAQRDTPTEKRKPN